MPVQIQDFVTSLVNRYEQRAILAWEFSENILADCIDPLENLQ